MYRLPLLGETENWLSRYISSIEDDREIARHIVLTLLEHVIELHRCGTIPREVACKICRALREIYDKIEELYSRQDLDRYEDFHELLEKHLVDKLGIDVAGWIGLGRSRNDHVVTAHRLKLREVFRDLIIRILELRRALIDRAEQHRDKMFIAFTHGQPAQVTLFSHYLLSIEEMLQTYVNMLLQVLEKVVEKSPLGCGPAVGTTVPIDRYREARDLCFNDICINALYCTESRDYLLITGSILSSLSVELSRVVNDLIRLADPQIGIIVIPEEHCATSSIMPHKRNPATLEIARARLGRVLGEYVSLCSIIRCVGKGYYLDLQEATPHVWNMARIIMNVLEILRDIFSKIRVNDDKVRKLVSELPVTSAETVEQTCLKSGRSFREIYLETARKIREGTACLLPPEDVLALRSSIGSASLRGIDRQISDAISRLEKDYNALRRLEERIVTAVSNVFRACDEVCERLCT
ncbi:MAG: argininosuccinate lyase [Crenarchaeota archaeon]|nr:argininosuccinate lyase [Thermoproteota archaeon]